LPRLLKHLYRLLAMRIDVPEYECPHCGAVHNALAGEGEPEEGDISVCVKCRALLVLHPGKVPYVTAITKEEFDMLPVEVLLELIWRWRND
jgi:hypothetical protein